MTKEALFPATSRAASALKLAESLHHALGRCIGLVLGNGSISICVMRAKFTHELPGALVHLGIFLFRYFPVTIRIIAHQRSATPTATSTTSSGFSAFL